MKKSILALLLAVLMVASLLPAAALADGGITVNGEGSYATLQAALEEAKDGDTIEFEAGMYDIGSVSTGKRVNIKGAGATTLIGTIQYMFTEPQTGNISISGITLEADTSTVQGIQFRAKEPMNESTLNINISNCAFDGWQYALTMNSHANGYNMTVSGCDFSDSLYAVSYSYDTKTTGQINKNTLVFGDNNVINPNGFAVQKFNNQRESSPDFSDKTYETVADFVAGKAVSGRVRYVSANGSIQAAVNAANDGDVIVVAPGTYNEVVTFGGKSLTIKAQNYAYANGFKLNDESKLSKFTGTFYTGAGSNPGSFKENQSITIIGFALSGNGLKIGTTNWSTVGSLTVKNCTMGFGNNLETTNYYKFNKFIYVNGGENGAFADFVVEDNYIGGTPLDGNYPLQLWGVKSASVRNNVFELSNAGNHQAIGISKLAADANVTVNNNKISGAGGGIYVTTWKCGGDSTGATAYEGVVTIQNNILTGAGAGNFKPIFVGYEVEGHAAFEGELNHDNNINNGATVVPEVGQKPGHTAYYLVTYYPNNGGDKMIQLAMHNETITLPAAPSKSGYAFLGWNDGVTTYSELAQYTVTKDTTFTAVWVRHPDTEYVPEPEQPVEPETPAFPFYDVPTSAWYYTAVKYVYDNKLMDGVDTYVFAPNDTLTRAMVWTIIARMSGVDTTGGSTWYAKAQEWVITNGISDGENPTAAITRQELVTMLYRYAQIKGYDVSVGEDTNILSYVDATSISEYAMSAFQWACGSGLTEGDENGALTPLATATRAQAAAMIMRFLSK